MKTLEEKFPLQAFTLKQIRKAGGNAWFCCSVEEIRDSLKFTLKEFGRGQFVAIELKNNKRLKLYNSETELKEKTLKMIKKYFPNAWVLKTSEIWYSGVPDLLICLG